jgi:phage tail-like protein
MAVFSELAGISSSVDVVDYVAGGGNEVLLLNRFVTARGPISLRLVRQRSNDPRISTWHREARANPTTRKKCTLAVYGERGQTIARYHLEDAWPSKIEPGGFTSSDRGTMSSEKVTITFEHIERVR